jgi:hypothetical protein
MLTYGIKINEQSMLAKLNKAIQREGRPIAQKKAYGVYYRAKKMMLRDFDAHPITNELKTGGATDNISLTTDNVGNLYAFLGFFAGADPTERLRSVLEVGTSFRYTRQFGNAWYFQVLFPSQDLIEQVTDLPWGGSWVDKIENGLDNLDSFIYKKGYGRSQQGIQAPYEINEGASFQEQPYLSEILANFKDRINNSTVNDYESGV